MLIVFLESLWAKFTAWSFGYWFMWTLFPPALTNTPMQWLNLANMQLTTQVLDRQLDLVLPDFSAPETINLYPALLEQIQAASDTTLIRVDVKNNRGGYDIVADAVYSVLSNTKAQVWMTITRDARSNGAFVLGASDYIFMPYDGILMFHTGRIVYADPETGKIVKMVRITHDNPETKEDAIRREKQLDKYRPWLTKEEQALFSTGESVELTGYDICTHGPERTVEILWKYKDGCVLKGMRYTQPSILEKLVIMKFGGY